jgi:hypothetical protein
LLDENFIKLLQNFANNIAPTTPLQGELWYDTSIPTNPFLRIYDGVGWLPVSPVWVSGTAPVTSQVGAQWWDSTNYQLNLYNGSGWTVIGPPYKIGDGKSGPLVEEVLDTLGASHTVIKFYTNNNVIAISSYDQPFTLSVANPILGFSVIGTGFTLAATTNSLFNGTATNSQQLNGIAASSYARNDIDSTFAGNILINSGTTTFTVSPTGTAKILNNNLNGNISFHANVGGVSTTMLHINALTGEVVVNANPISALGVATKQYSDNSVATAIAPLAPTNNPAFTGTPTAPNAAVGTNTTQIASTAFVQTTVSSANSALWLGSSKTISTNTPTNGAGNPGDFWFQI